MLASLSYDIGKSYTRSVPLWVTLIISLQNKDFAEKLDKELCNICNKQP